MNLKSLMHSRSPDVLSTRHEAMAFFALWLIWPAAVVISAPADHVLGDLCVSLPASTRLSLLLITSAENLLPTLAGTFALVVSARLVARKESRDVICHAITLAAFGYTLLMAAWLGPIWSL